MRENINNSNQSETAQILVSSKSKFLKDCIITNLQIDESFMGFFNGNIPGYLGNLLSQRFLL